MSADDANKGYNFRFNEPQWLAYMKFMEFVYAQGRSEDNRDLEKVILWRTIGMNDIAYKRGVSASSLADSLNLPRETVRRKCEEMVADGWVDRDDDGYIMGPRIGATIYGLIEDSIEGMLKAARQIEALGAGETPAEGDATEGA